MLWSIRPRYVSNAETPVTRDHHAGAVDLLTGMLQLSLNVQSRGGEGCNDRVSIFNGKERYDLRGAYVDSRDVFQGAYEGRVAICTVYYVPIAGYEREDTPSERFLRTPVNVWFSETGASSAPVRMSYSTGFGDLVMPLETLGGGRR